jgi:hypothetical protein
MPRTMRVSVPLVRTGGVPVAQQPHLVPEDDASQVDVGEIERVAANAAASPSPLVVDGRNGSPHDQVDI